MNVENRRIRKKYKMYKKYCRFYLKKAFLDNFKIPL